MKFGRYVVLFCLVFGTALAQPPKKNPPELTPFEKLAFQQVQEEAQKLQQDVKILSDEYAKNHPGWTWDMQHGPVFTGSDGEKATKPAPVKPPS